MGFSLHSQLFIYHFTRRIKSLKYQKLPTRSVQSYILKKLLINPLPSSKTTNYLHKTKKLLADITMISVIFSIFTAFVYYEGSYLKFCTEALQVRLFCYFKRLRSSILSILIVHNPLFTDLLIQT